MKKSRFTEEQILAFLAQTEIGVPVASLCTKHNISEGTFYKWHSRYGGSAVEQLKRVRKLEGENAVQRRLLRKQAAEIAALKEVLQANLNERSKRKVAVDVLMKQGLSERQACEFANLARSSWRYATPPYR